MTLRRGTVVGIAVLGLVVLEEARARADVVPPSLHPCGKDEREAIDHGRRYCVPTKCPAGKVLGAPGGGDLRCVDPAPKNCPPGWKGLAGALCTPALCNEKGSSCPQTTTCKASPVCATDKTEEIGRGVASTRSYSGPCDASLACGQGAACLSVRVCLPADADRMGATPAHAQTARIVGNDAVPTDEPPARKGGAPRDEGPSEKDASAPKETPSRAPASPLTPTVDASAAEKPPSTVPPAPGRGGAGCAFVASASPLGSTGASGLALVASLAVLRLGRRLTRRVRGRARRPSSMA